jgi:hypothetical protein
VELGFFASQPTYSTICFVWGVEVDERILKVAWNIVEELNSITSLIRPTPPAGEAVDVQHIFEARQRTADFIAKVIEGGLKCQGVEL